MVYDKHIKMGVAIIAFGATMLLWATFATPTKKEKIDEDIPQQHHKEKGMGTTWLPYLGTVLVAGGLVIVVAAKK